MMFKKLLTALFWIHILVVPAWGTEPGTWEDYKERFITRDGRIIDFYQNQCSHSEGQGYGMLLAVHFNDLKTFSRIFEWTQRNLMVRQDGLVAWKWGKRINGDWGVIDYNNASDGDLLIAWACLNAWKKWQNQLYLATAETIIHSIKKHLVIEMNGQKILLPGYFGFDKNKRIRIYPNYSVFPAFQAFAQHDDKYFWQDLTQDSLSLIKRSLFSKFHLPADWILLKINPKLPVDRQAYGDFNYEAIRVPLYLAMAGETKLLQSFSSFLTLSHSVGYLPVQVDLSEDQISVDDAPAGFYAIMAKCAQANGYDTIAKTLMKTANKKVANERRDYYSVTLYLIAKTMVTL